MTKESKQNHKFKRSYFISRGYRYIYKPNYFNVTRKGYVLEHRFVYETFYKCCILRWGIVHHKDENRLNNKIENLQGMTRKQHLIIHIKKNNRRCQKCKSDTSYLTKKGYDQWWKYNNNLICYTCINKIPEFRIKEYLRKKKLYHRKNKKQ